MKCLTCGAALEGAFELDSLSALSPKQRQFIVSFLKCRGNIREMEKTYAISYPTVRARLDEIVAALGEAPVVADFCGNGADGGRSDGDFCDDSDGGSDCERAGRPSAGGITSGGSGGASRERMPNMGAPTRQLRHVLLEKLAKKEIDAQTAMQLIEQMRPFEKKQGHEDAPACAPE
jgi:hypothetical protein